jgi:hypothetical protein
VRPPAEAFLSHSDRNRAFATKIATTLQARGIEVFYSRRHLRGAQEWHDEIGAALARCDWFLLVLSPEAVRSEWVKRELLYALQHAQYRGRIAPLVHRACDVERLSWTLSGLQSIDFRSGTYLQ